MLENRSFTLQTDPHKCKFGLWYDKYRTDDFDLNGTLRQFDGPHKAIHKLSENAEEFIKSGHRDKAIELITITGKTILSSMVKLFDLTSAMIQKIDKRLLVITKINNSKKALLVDAASDALRIEPSAFSEDTSSLITAHKFASLKTGMAELLEPKKLF